MEATITHVITISVAVNHSGLRASFARQLSGTLWRATSTVLDDVLIV